MLLFLAVWITSLEKNLFLFFGYELEDEFLYIVIINKIYKYECNELVFIHQYPDKVFIKKTFPLFLILQALVLISSKKQNVICSFIL